MDTCCRLPPCPLLRTGYGSTCLLLLISFQPVSYQVAAEDTRGALVDTCRRFRAVLDAANSAWADQRWWLAAHTHEETALDSWPGGCRHFGWGGYSRVLRALHACVVTRFRVQLAGWVLG